MTQTVCEHIILWKIFTLNKNLKTTRHSSNIFGQNFMKLAHNAVNDCHSH